MITSACYYSDWLLWSANSQSIVSPNVPLAIIDFESSSSRFKNMQRGGSIQLPLLDRAAQVADMKPIKRRSGNQYMHHESHHYREKIRRKLHAYHVIEMGVIMQGLMQYLSVCHTELVWNSFGSCGPAFRLRTIRKNVAPSELVVKIALQNTLGVFIRTCLKTNELAKFIADRQDPDRAQP